MTPQGKQTLVSELKHLREVVRPEVVAAIEEARAHGDLSENAEYDAAKERQSLTEARFRLVEARIAMSEVIDVTEIEISERVIFGTTIELLDVDTDEELTYRIVGEDEANAKEGTISFKSPIASAIIGKLVGDEVKVSTPKGVRALEILEVHYR
jgi:transcription elongation factor GreA